MSDDAISTKVCAYVVAKCVLESPVGEFEPYIRSSHHEEDTKILPAVGVGRVRFVWDEMRFARPGAARRAPACRTGQGLRDRALADHGPEHRGGRRPDDRGHQVAGRRRRERDPMLRGTPGATAGLLDHGEQADVEDVMLDGAVLNALMDDLTDFSSEETAGT